MTNSKQLTLKRLHKQLQDHFEDDRRNFATINKRFENVATKEDTNQILEAIKAVKIGFGIFQVGWKTISVIAGIVAFVAAITGAWKIILGWFIISNHG